MAQTNAPSNIVTLTPAAVDRVRELVNTHSDGALGIRLGVKTTGCSGYSYQMDFADEIKPGDEVIEAGDVKVIVDPMAVMFVLGTEVDYVTDKLGAMFVFNNPNEASRCGCGESFTV